MTSFTVGDTVILKKEISSDLIKGTKGRVKQLGGGAILVRFFLKNKKFFETWVWHEDIRKAKYEIWSQIK